MAGQPIAWFVKSDVDGFFGLFTDNLVQLLLIVALCQLCGIGPTDPLLSDFILPAAGISILLGNLFYAAQAYWLMRREQRTDVTALPYGINTVSLIIYVFFIMVPVYQRTQSAEQAWLMGVLACLGSGLIELTGALVAETVRRYTPRAALLATLSGIAIGFISMSFALQVFQRPLVAMVPLAVILATYFGKVTFPLGIPGGVIAILLGTLAAWLLPMAVSPDLVGLQMSSEAVAAGWAARGWHAPQWVAPQLWSLIQQRQEWWGYLSVIVPMGLFNLIGSLQNIESAEAAGDRYSSRWSLAINGLGSILGALTGSCFPTTIYIGHPGWKAMGARAGYSVLNGLVILAICLTGTVGLIQALIPIEAGIAIVLWIGIVITAQAFQSTPREHAPAVAMGLFPAIAAWGQTVTVGTFIYLGLAAAQTPTLQSLLGDPEQFDFQVNSYLVHGMITIERGYIFTCMFLAAMTASLIDGRLRAAAWWAVAAALFAAVGLTHAYQVRGNDIDFLFALNGVREGHFGFRATSIACGYLAMAVFFVICEQLMRRSEGVSLKA
jgi:AGZA family xanthine/uracil permease-like MFS transporter